MRRWWVRSVAGLLALVVVLLASSPASAHVLLAQAQPNGDGSTTLTFTFDHGCGESPTVELMVSLPTGATPPDRPTQPGGWHAEAGATRVTWTGPALRAHSEVAFSLVTRLTGTVGQTLHFPTVQKCANGEVQRWIDTEPGAEEPAPSLVATQAVLATVPVAAPPNSSVAGSADAANFSRAALALVLFVLVATAGAAIFTWRRGAPSQ